MFLGGGWRRQHPLLLVVGGYYAIIMLHRARAASARATVPVTGGLQPCLSASLAGVHFVCCMPVRDHGTGSTEDPLWGT